MKPYRPHIDDFEDIHRDCGSSWECVCCGRLVCWRCDPSPDEPSLCVECSWFQGGAA